MVLYPSINFAAYERVPPPDPKGANPFARYTAKYAGYRAADDESPYR